MPNKVDSQTENLNALGFVTNLARKNLVIAVFIVLLIFIVALYFDRNRIIQANDLEKKQLRAENIALQNRLIDFQNAIITRYQKIEDKQKEIENEQKKVDMNLQKLSKTN